MKIRIHKQSKKTYLVVLLIIVVCLGVGTFVWHKYNKTATPVAATVNARYVSFEGSYTFAIPENRSVDEISIPGVALVYSGDSVQAKSFDELYANGVIAIQPISALKDNNTEALKKYANDVVTADLRKSLHSASDLQELKQGNIVIEKAYAIDKDGKRLRTIYAFGLTQPVLAAAADEGGALKIISSSIEDFNKSKLKPDIDKAANTTKQILTLAKSKDASGILKQSTGDLRKKMSKDKLSEALQASASRFDGSVAIVGGSYNGNVFIAQVLFRTKNDTTKFATGTVELHKEGDVWKLQAMQLPTS